MSSCSSGGGGGCQELEPYALRVVGESMAPEFWDGCIVIVEPGARAVSGSYIILDYGDDVFLRQLVVEGERRFIRALNPNNALVELIPPYTIKGVISQRAGTRRAHRKHYL